MAGLKNFTEEIKLQAMKSAQKSLLLKKKAPHDFVYK